MPELTLPLRYYSSGRSDFQSSQIVIQHINANGDPYKTKSVAFLAGFAIELLLKAWLSADGVDEKTVCAHGIRHNLAVLLKMATDRGLNDDSKMFAQIVSIFDKIHASFETRYLKEDTEIPKLDIHAYSSVMASLDATVRAKLQLPALT